MTPDGAANARRPLVIGLVNNMPDAALASTERQFEALLSDASANRDVILRYSSLLELPRGAAAHLHIRSRYWSLADLWEAGLDGLIVTGNEPRAASLNDEPYWSALVEVIARAATSVPSTIFSCLAAHAAVLHFDGIERRRLSEKRSGIYVHAVDNNHALTLGLAAELPTPHSRWNDLAAPELIHAGYRMLSASPANGADVFVRERQGRLLVFLQGHLEYESETLLREYRRDVLRYASGEAGSYPTLPAGYFTPAARSILRDFEAQVRAGTVVSPATDFPYAAAASGVENRWHAPAVRLYANWLTWLDGYRQQPGG